MDISPTVHEQPVPGMDPVAARRWRALERGASPWLHEEVARRMAERLQWIKREPQHWLDWSATLGGLQGHQLVAKLYPKAQVSWGGDGAQQAQRQLRQLEGGRWNPLKWLPAAPKEYQGAGDVDMLWANMALHLDPLPRTLLGRWRDALKVDGFLMFSCLGPDTLREVRVVYEREGWPLPTHAYTDMHDWGDMLVEVGFAEPVMDMERITLGYASANRLLQDLRDWGRNLHDARFPGLRGRAWRQQLERALEAGLPRDEQGQMLVTFEVVYGHAFKPAPKIRLTESSTVSVEDMRTLLRQPRVR